ncbi:MAG TPA: four helix bundle protein [Candidatus Goldiibacteriota bacterium]|nr:four helix bundle protein [Candidatus Goldiibacteriota bacterium]HRQ44391.1 four helix bundle protein [Candidatus Goldiibacteriota bacterium]
MEYQFDLRSRSYAFNVKVIKKFRKYYEQRFYRSMIDQLIRSAGSVGANLTESKHSDTIREYVRYYDIALRSGNETLYWMNLLKDTLEEETDEISTLIVELKEILKVLAQSVKTLRKNRDAKKLKI